MLSSGKTAKSLLNDQKFKSCRIDLLVVKNALENRLGGLRLKK